MEQKNILNITTREDFGKWLIQNLDGLRQHIKRLTV